MSEKTPEKTPKAPTEAAAPAGKAAKPADPTITVTAKVDGFRRGGRRWSDQPTAVPVSDLTAAQLAQIKAEPKLVVVDNA